MPGAGDDGTRVLERPPWSWFGLGTAHVAPEPDQVPRGFLQGKVSTAHSGDNTRNLPTYSNDVGTNFKQLKADFGHNLSSHLLWDATVTEGVALGYPGRGAHWMDTFAVSPVSPPSEPSQVKGGGSNRVQSTTAEFLFPQGSVESQVPWEADVFSQNTNFHVGEGSPPCQHRCRKQPPQRQHAEFVLPRGDQRVRTVLFRSLATSILPSTAMQSEVSLETGY